jgi:16S rRNA (cytosine967-C5)-methyltransferase
VNSRAVAARILSSYQHEYFNFEKKVAAAADDLELSAKDRDFLYILVKGVLLYRDYLDYAIEMAAQRPVARFEKVVLNLLRLGAFQQLILGTPRYALTNETVAAARELNKRRATGIINAVLRHLPDKRQIADRLSELPANKALAIGNSHPQWMIDRWIRQYGFENTRQITEFNNGYRKIYFRHNPLKITWLELQKSLAKAGFDVRIATESIPIFFTVDRPGDLLRSHYFIDGLMSVQDISQSFGVHLLDPKPDEIVIDVCAAPGGKTTMIAQMTGSAGQLYAYDIESAKVKLIQNETFRLGIDFVNYSVGDARSDSYPMADKILLDVPCSGSGVLARRADLRWNRTASDLEKLVVLQREILDNVQRYVKPGGLLVYCTCSIEGEENWENVDWFMNHHPKFGIESAAMFIDAPYCDERGAVVILPHIHGETGSFAVRLRHTE